MQVDRRAGDPLRFVGPGPFGAFVAKAIAGFAFFEFVVLNACIELRHDGDPDAATARMYMCELRQGVEDGHFTIAYGLYQDRYARTDAGWRFAERHYASMARSSADESRDLDVFPFPKITNWRQ